MDRSDMMDGLDFGVETVSDFEALSDSPLRLLALGMSSQHALDTGSNHSLKMGEVFEGFPAL
jgi:hypothetical protein